MAKDWELLMEEARQEASEKLGSTWAYVVRVGM